MIDRIIWHMNAVSPTVPSDIPRRTFTVRDVQRMVEMGLFAKDEHVELIFGELIPKSPKGARHETIKRAFLEHWYRNRPETTSILPETTFRLGPDTYLEPDFILFPSMFRTADIANSTVLLAVEIAESSLVYDLGPKPQIYAHFGIRELWVIDAAKLRIHVHRVPENSRYSSITVHTANELVTPCFAPVNFAVCLADLHLDTL